MCRVIKTIVIHFFILLTLVIAQDSLNIHPVISFGYGSSEFVSAKGFIEIYNNQNSFPSQTVFLYR